MKSVVISAALAVVMVTGALVYMNRLCYVSESLIEMNDSVSQYLENEDYDSASAEINKIKDYIDKKHTLLEAVGNHSMLDEIEMNIFELQSYVKGGYQTDAMSKCRVLGFLFEHMPKNEYVKLENIL